MLRFKMVLLSLFAMLVLGVMASASASAADSCNGGEHWVFCTYPGNEPIHELEVSGTSTLSVLASKVGTTEVKLHCPDDTFAGTLHLLGLAEGEISFLSCTVEKPANCTIASLILAEIHIQVLSSTDGIATGNKAGGAAQEFTSVTLGGNNCTVKGTYTITGTQEVEFPEGGSGKAEHEIVAKKAGSHLKLGVEPASFSSTANVHLDDDEPWLIMEGK